MFDPIDLIKRGASWLLARLTDVFSFVRRQFQAIERWIYQRLGLALDPIEAESTGIEETQRRQAERGLQVIPQDSSDRTALARMLASEDRARPIKIVVGWITVTRARARKQSLFQFLTEGLGYGKQDRTDKGQGILYAATTKAPSRTDLELADGLLSGSIQPSAAIRKHRPGGWVERDTGIISDEGIVAKQKKWDEGIYGRLADSNWVLFSPDSPKISQAPNQSAKQLLDTVPFVPALDDGGRLVA